MNADREATRAEVAKTSFYGAYFGPKNVPDELAVDNYPSVYSDLQDKTTYYYRPAKALLYLEYGDGVAPFDRNRLAFEPEDKIARTHVLKELLETFNIKPESDYISKAASLGIITSSENFRPNDNCTRGEAFLMLARIMQKIEAGDIADPKPQEADYFEPLNTTLKTISLGASLQMGNFQHYTKTSFALSGVPIHTILIILLCPAYSLVISRRPRRMIAISRWAMVGVITTIRLLRWLAITRRVLLIMVCG